jgi:lysozyme
LKNQSANTPSSPTPLQALIWLIALIIIPYTFIIRQKVAAHWYTEMHCDEPRRRNWSSFEVPVPSNYEVVGIDVSHYSCPIDWAAVKRMQSAGKRVSFAYMRATKGLDLVDYTFKDNWRAAKEAGVPRGAYHFYKFSYDAVAQANFFLENVALQRGDLPPVLDIENDRELDDRRLDRVKVLRSISRWLEAVAYKTGKKPMIYCNLDYYKRYIAGNFTQYPIWIASYKTQVGSAPKLPDGRQWHFWQVSESARCQGISEPIDLNVFSGTLAQLEALTW